MFDIGWSELAVIAVVALVVIGPKDLPRVLRSVGQWVARARAVARDFQSSIDEMAREADLQDVKKQIDELRTTNVADLIEKHVDPKGEIRQALEPPPELAAGVESGAPAPVVPFPSDASYLPPSPEEPTTIAAPAVPDVPPPAAEQPVGADSVAGTEPAAPGSAEPEPAKPEPGSAKPGPA
ncbi:MAG: Sec-independent protein translocase protein TatB [Alphaproteobacteria bacterium]